MRLEYELLSISNFSLLFGVEAPDNIVQSNSAKGFRGIGINDYNSFLGSIRGILAAQKFNIQVFLSTRINLENFDLIIFPLTKEGYRQACRLLSYGFDSIREFSYFEAVGILKFKAPGGEEKVEIILKTFHLVAVAFLPFKGNVTVAQHFSNKYGLSRICTFDPAYISDESRFVSDCLIATKLQKKLSELVASDRVQSHWTWVHAKNYSDFFSKDLIEETNKIGDLLPTNLLREVKQIFPESKMYPSEKLSELCRSKLCEKGLLKPKYQALLERELRIISDLGYERFFLLCYEIISHAKALNIFCQGRGAAANSIVCYLLDITPVHPDEIDFLFERFISSARNEPPDIDIDFESNRRQEIFEYIFSTYKDRSALVSAIFTYHPRSAYRDVGRALDVPLSKINEICKLANEWENYFTHFENFYRRTGLSKQISYLWYKIAQRFITLPRHFTQHVGGVLFHDREIRYLGPTYPSRDGSRLLIQFTNDEIDALKFVKVDILGLGMLSAIRESLDLLKERNLEISPSKIKANDSKVYELISSGNTIGVFQVESRAQQAMVTRLRPKNFYDLVIEVAIVRPGPIHGDMVHPYLKRRTGEEKVEFPDEKVRSILEKTLGVPLFQEQAMRLAKEVAGLNEVEVEEFRRALKNYKPGNTQLEVYKDLIRDRLINAGYSEEFAWKCMEQIKGFSMYGFPESHAASFAKLVYFSAYLKKYYSAYFYAGLLNSFPVGFYNPRQLITDAVQNGVKVIPQCINQSEIKCTVKNNSLILGFNLIKGLREDSINKIIKIRSLKPFESFEDFLDRANYDLQTMISLIKGGCFDNFDPNRRALIFKTLTGLYKNNLKFSEFNRFVYDSIIREFSSGRNYISTYLKERSCNALTYNTLMKVKPRVGEMVRVAGLASIKQRPVTAKGYAFICLEDDYGFINLVVAPYCLKKYLDIILKSEFIVADGTVENYLADRIPYVKAKRIYSI